MPICNYNSYCQVIFSEDCISVSVAINESAYLNTSLLTVCNETSCGFVSIHFNLCFSFLARYSNFSYIKRPFVFPFPELYISFAHFLCNVLDLPISRLSIN